MSRTGLPKAGQAPAVTHHIGRYVGADYLEPDGAWSLTEFHLLNPIPHHAVEDVLKQRVRTEAAGIRQGADLPCGAAVRLMADDTGHQRETFLHRSETGGFQLIRRLLPRCTMCGGERVMFVYPDRTAMCGVCEMARD
jgi:hypothetical protein